MLRELLGDTYRVGLAHIELNDLKEPPQEIQTAELIFKDQINWKALPDRLRIEFTNHLFCRTFFERNWGH